MTEDGVIKSVYWTPKVHIMISIDLHRTLIFMSEVLLGDCRSLSRVSLCWPGYLQEYCQSDWMGPPGAGDIPGLLRHCPGQRVLNVLSPSQEYFLFYHHFRPEQRAT